MAEPARGDTRRKHRCIQRWGYCPACQRDRWIHARGWCGACYQRWQRERRQQASAPRASDQLADGQGLAVGQALAVEPPVRRPRVYPPRTVDRPGVCVGCQQVRIIKARGLCSHCRKEHPERALPLREPAGRLEDVPTWTPEWGAHLDALAERVLRGEPVVGTCKTRRDKDV